MKGARTEQGAAEMVGVLMLISLLVVVIGIIAVVMFSTPPPDKNPAVNLRITNDSRLVKLYNAGGDTLQAEKIQIYVDGILRTFNGYGPDNIWSLGEVLEYTVPASEPMPNKVDIVYTEDPRRGTNSALIATLLLGDQTSVQQDRAVYTISASSGPGGSISQSGEVSVISGDSVSFVITPDLFNTIDDVTVDGVSQGPVPSYLFSSVTESHTIIATFSSPTAPFYRINVTAGPGGMVNPGNVSVFFGEDKTYTITPDSCHSIASVVVNKTYPQGMVSMVKFTNVTTNQALDATFTSSYLPGITGNYYKGGNSWTTMTASGSRTDAKIRFADAAAVAAGQVTDETNWPNSMVARQDDFSVIWDGYLRVPTADSYTFSLRSDSGACLQVDGTILINSGCDSGDVLHTAHNTPTTDSGTRSLSPGYHHIVVKMFETTGTAVARLDYQTPSMATVQPVTDLWHKGVDFEGTPVWGVSPFTVYFTDKSTNSPTSWQWDFGDGNTTGSTLKNPSHLYKTMGSYSVSLNTSASGCGNSVTKDNYITAGKYVKGWNAKYYSDEGWTDLVFTNNPLRINFQNDYCLAHYPTTITELTDVPHWPIPYLGADEYYSAKYDSFLKIDTPNTYTFYLESDDGSSMALDGVTVIDNSGLHQPEVKTYSTPLTVGYHPITVKMFNHAGGADVALKYSSPSLPLQFVTNVWRITAVDPPVASFTASPTTGGAPLTIQFTDTSSVNTPTIWSWTFGDGDLTNSTQQNPVHTYATAGTYAATLTATNDGGSSVSSPQSIVVAPSAPVASFTVTPLTGQAPLTVFFTDTSTNTPTSWLWEFDDGNTTGNTLKNPTHLYEDAGIYTVFLTATNSIDSDISTTQAITVLPPPPTVTDVTPEAGPIVGGTAVVITGTDFTGVSSVRFGSTLAGTYTVDSPTQITVTSPAHGAGTVDVTVTTASGTSAFSTIDHFSYGVPTITLVSPASGPTGGGNMITITGTDFVGVTSVKFDTRAASSFTVVSSTSITAVCPNYGTSDTVDITVTGAGGTSAIVPADHYTFGRPAVTAVTPKVGPVAGGTTVTLTGAGFTGVSAVKFGGTNAASYTVNSDTQITAISPARSAGTIDITVTIAAGTSATSTLDRFTYAAVPTVTKIAPAAGSSGTGVTITGTAFSGTSFTTTKVLFGSTAATSFTVGSATTITAYAPAGSGTVDITVTTPGGTSAISSVDKFSYGVPTIISISPTNGPKGGNTWVTITGTGFTGVTAAANVKFGGTNAKSYTVDSPTQITARSPGGAVGTVEIRVTNPAGTSALVTADRFTYY